MISMPTMIGADKFLITRALTVGFRSGENSSRRLTEPDEFIVSLFAQRIWLLFWIVWTPSRNFSPWRKQVFVQPVSNIHLTLWPLTLHRIYFRCDAGWFPNGQELSKERVWELGDELVWGRVEFGLDWSAWPSHWQRSLISFGMSRSCLYRQSDLLQLLNLTWK